MPKIKKLTTRQKRTVLEIKTANLVVKKSLLFDFKKIGILFSFFIVSFGLTFMMIKGVFWLIKNKPKIPKINLPKVEQKVDFRGNENYLIIDPVLLKSYIDGQKKDFILVDVRSSQEYERGHIKGAKNLPLYQDYQKTYESLIKKDDWIKGFRSLIKGKKLAIVYGYSANSDLIRVAVDDLRKLNLPVKLLSVGWGEWQNLPAWLPGADLNNNFSFNDYIERPLQ